MATNLLTARKVETAKPQEKEYLLADGEGLYLRIRPQGQKDWFFIYTLNKKRSKLAIHASALAEVRLIANEYRELLARKIDPKQHLADVAQREADALHAAQQAKAAKESRLSVTQLFDKWESIDLRHHKNGSSEIRRSFTKDVFPLIGDKAAADVTKADVMRIVDSLLARNVNRMAKLLFSQIRQMFRFALDRGYVDHDPTASIRKANVFGRDIERDRVLSESEIIELASAIAPSGLALSSASALWIALSTGCRIGEISQAKWSDVDIEARTWVIPKEASKNNQGLTVYLSEFALKHFQVLQTLTNGPYCIPNRDASEHIGLKAITKQVGDRQVDSDKPSLEGRTKAKASLLLSGGKWTPHDLRRTAGTLMTQLGVLPEIADRCLNHIEQNRIKRTYLRHSYEPEKKEAWELLGKRLEQLTNTPAQAS
jgi:integrase